MITSKISKNKNKNCIENSKINLIVTFNIYLSKIMIILPMYNIVMKICYYKNNKNNIEISYNIVDIIFVVRNFDRHTNVFLSTTY